MDELRHESKGNDWQISLIVPDSLQWSQQGVTTRWEERDGFVCLLRLFFSFLAANVLATYQTYLRDGLPRYLTY